MILYHGTNVEFDVIDLAKSKPNKDFGQGFYLTADYVIAEYGGCEKFYNDFYMNFVFPLGIAKINPNNSESNCNYYEIKQFETKLYDYIIKSIKEILSFNIDTSICYCIGSGKNYEFLL